MTLVVFAFDTAKGATKTWVGPDNGHWSYNNGEYWSPSGTGVPTADDDVYINNGHTCVIDQDDASCMCNTLHLGSGSTQTGTLQIKAGGGLTVGQFDDENVIGGDAYVGDAGTGTLTIEGDPDGELDGGWAKCYGTVYVARTPGSTGTINVSGNGLILPQMGALWAGTDMFLGGWATLQQEPLADPPLWIWHKHAGGTAHLNIFTMTDAQDVVQAGSVVVDDNEINNHRGTLVLCNPLASVIVDKGRLEVESLDGVAGSTIRISDGQTDDTPPVRVPGLTIRARQLGPDDNADDYADNAGNFAGQISDYTHGPGTVWKRWGNIQTVSGQHSNDLTIVDGGWLRLGGPTVLDDTGSAVVRWKYDQNAYGGTLDLNGFNIGNETAQARTVDVDVDGHITGITVTRNGSGYTSVPAVTISDPGGNGSGAAATAVMGVGCIALTNAGWWYVATDFPPQFPLTFTGGGATTPATGHAFVENGMVTKIVLDSPGEGYTSQPTIDFSAGGGSGAAGIAYLTVNSLTVTAAGSNYSLTPAVAITAPPGVDADVHLVGSGADTYIGALLNDNTVTRSSCNVPVTLTGHTTIGGGGNTTLNGGFYATSITWNLTKVAHGILNVAVNNTYRGITYIDGGTFQLGGPGVLDDTNAARVRWGKNTVELEYGGTLDLNGFSIGGTVNVFVDGMGPRRLTTNQVPFERFGALINTWPTIGSVNTNSPTIGVAVTIGSDSLPGVETVVGGVGCIKLTGSLTVQAAHRLMKICTGTLMIACTQSWGAGSVFAVGALIATALNMNFGVQDDGNGPYGNATSSISNVQAELTAFPSAPDESDSAIIGFEATQDGKDAHTLNDVLLNFNEYGSPLDLGTALVQLGPGDPAGLGDGGSVELQLYTAGTEPGADPSDAEHRAVMEDIWAYVVTAYYWDYQQGVTTHDCPAAESDDVGLSMRVKRDSYGAYYLSVELDLKGDIVPDGLGDHRVNSFDVSQLIYFKDRPLPWTDPETGITYRWFTWAEGDLNGDGYVDDTDLDILLDNLGEVYDPTQY